jgi:hypothetical protein
MMVYGLIDRPKITKICQRAPRKKMPKMARLQAKCPVCSGALYGPYKGRENQAKCINCGKWIIGLPEDR